MCGVGAVDVRKPNSIKASSMLGLVPRHQPTMGNLFLDNTLVVIGTALRVNAAHVLFHGIHADEQLFSDLAVGAAILM